MGFSRSLGAFMRVRVLVNVTKPLLRGTLIARKGKEPIRVQFKYDKLGNLCYKCGLLCHLTKDCDMVTGDASVSLPYGDWVRVDSANITFKSKDSMPEQGDSSEAS